MRYDINILWIEDSQDWQNKAERLFRLRALNDGLSLNINWISKDDVKDFESKIKNESIGYKVFDIIFVDYNISNNVTGDKIITALRESNIDADILFYSANLNEDQKKKIILDSGTAFDGIYLADRSDFQEKAMNLYKKNTKRLTSLLNVRGLVTDKTSENDFIMNSYLLKNINKLDLEKRKILDSEIKDILKTQIEFVRNKLEDGDEIVKGNSDITATKLYNLPDFVFPISNKYQVFKRLLELNGSTMFDDKLSIEEYINKIIKIRNTLAHKKIDVCKQQKYLKYYDTIKQYNERQCSATCNNHTDENKISLDQWSELLKMTNDYTKRFDETYNELIEDNTEK